MGFVLGIGHQSIQQLDYGMRLVEQDIIFKTISILLFDAILMGEGQKEVTYICRYHEGVTCKGVKMY